MPVGNQGAYFSYFFNQFRSKHCRVSPIIKSPIALITLSLIWFALTRKSICIRVSWATAALGLLAELNSASLFDPFLASKWWLTHYNRIPLSIDANVLNVLIADVLEGELYLPINWHVNVIILLARYDYLIFLIAAFSLKRYRPGESPDNGSHDLLFNLAENVLDIVSNLRWNVIFLIFWRVINELVDFF